MSLPYSAKNAPGCEFRFYAPGSALNADVGKNPKLDPRSAEMMRFCNFNIPQNRISGSTGSADYMHPVYFAVDVDPFYRVRLTKPWGANALSGASIRMPQGAKPAGGGDGHLCIVQPDGSTVDLWQARVDETARTITASWGGRGNLSGDGITDAPATAAWFGLAFQARACEIAAGLIDHALFIVPTFVDPGPWAPARGDAQTREDPSWPRGKRPHTGQRLWLDMLPAEIDSLAEPAWAKGFLRSASRKGMLVGDSGHYGTVGVSINVESMQPYETFLGVNPLKDYLRYYGLPYLNLGPVFERVRDRLHWLAAPV